MGEKQPEVHIALKKVKWAEALEPQQVPDKAKASAFNARVPLTN